MASLLSIRGMSWAALRAALGGVVLVEVVNVLLNPPRAGEPVDWASVAAIAVVGAIIGWMYELARSMAQLIAQSLVQFEALSEKLDYQDQALSMLIRSPRHGEALTELVSDSIRKNFRHIAFVDANRYLHYLVKAVDHSDGFKGIQRRPVRWFLEEGAEGYLLRLRDRRMRYKLRLFVIGDRDEAAMREDLADRNVMDFYWRSTGEDVRTFWIREADLRHTFPGVQIPDDFGLYDDQLLIAYDPGRQVVSFDLLGADSNEQRIFRKLQEQLELGASTPFIEITPLSSRSRTDMAVQGDGLRERQRATDDDQRLP